jgi:hypothetical protein
MDVLERGVFDQPSHAEGETGLNGVIVATGDAVHGPIQCIHRVVVLAQ